MHAYVAAAKRMFWPVVSSTATTLCAFLPMLFWPGVPGQFMGMLPITLIFVLSASLLVALVYLPVMGGVTGRVERWFDTASARSPCVLAVAPALFPLAPGCGGRRRGRAGTVGNVYRAVRADGRRQHPGLCRADPGDGLRAVAGRRGPGRRGGRGGGDGAAGADGRVRRIRYGARALRGWALPRRPAPIRAGYRRSAFGRVIHLVVGNPVAPLLAFGAVFVLVGAIFMFYMNNNNGTEFFVESEPENAIVYVRARGNLSIDQKAEIVERAEDIVLAHPNVKNAFAFAGDGGLNNNTGGAQPPRDTIGQIQFEMLKWEDRPRVRRPGSPSPLPTSPCGARSWIPPSTATAPSRS